MNRERDFDETLAMWLDEGADTAPERFVWAAIDDVERTPQRGSWLVSLEEFFMHLKPAAPILGVVAVAALAVATYQFVWAPNVGGPTIGSRQFTADDLPAIVMNEENAPAGFTVDEASRRTGAIALAMPLRPGGDTIDATAFVDALSITGGDDAGGYTTWTALFETPEAANDAFEFIAAEHDSPDGWDLADTRTDPGLGEESASWIGQQYDFVPSAQTIFWREGNLLLAVVGFADWDAEEVRMIDQMADRAK
jgi:hypothetical protein